MRNPKRIDRIVDKLRTAWHASPDLRFGQLVDMLVNNYIRCGVHGTHLVQIEDRDTEKGLSRFLKGRGIQSPAPRPKSPCVTAASAVDSLNKLIDEPAKKQVIEDLFSVGVPGEVFAEDSKMRVHEEKDGRQFITVIGLLNSLFPSVVIKGEERGAISSVYKVVYAEEGSEELKADLANFQETTLELLEKTEQKEEGGDSA